MWCVEVCIAYSDCAGVSIATCRIPFVEPRSHQPVCHPFTAYSRKKLGTWIICFQNSAETAVFSLHVLSWSTYPKASFWSKVMLRTVRLDWSNFKGCKHRLTRVCEYSENKLTTYQIWCFFLWFQFAPQLCNLLGALGPLCTQQRNDANSDIGIPE